MLTGGDNITTDVITFLARVFQCSFYIHTRFRFALSGRNLKSPSTGNHRGIGGGIQTQFQRRSCKLSSLFTPRR